MVLRINPSRSPVWRTPNEFQVGEHRIAGLTPAQQRLISLLLRGIPTDSLPTVAKELEVDDVEQFIERIGPTLLHDSPPAPLDRDYIEQHFAEICRAQSSYGIDGSRVIAARRQARVFVDAAATSSRIVDALRASGIERLHTATAAPKNLAALDVAITADQSAIRPLNHRRFLSLAVPHVAIQFDSTGVFISPLIEVGKTPCLTCLQLTGGHEQVAIDSQLLFSNQRFDDAVSEHFAIAIATQTALKRIDQQASLELEGFEVSEIHRNGYRLNSATGTIHELQWQFAEGCLCHRESNE